MTTLTDSGGVRRHSDLVATLTAAAATDTGVITRPYVEDEPIVPERLRPKHNSVSNVIYQEYVVYLLSFSIH